MQQPLSGLGIKFEEIESTLMNLNLIEKNLSEWTKDDFKSFAVKLREKSKPIVIAANKIDLKEAKENLKKLKERFPEKIIIGCSAEAEYALKKAHKAGLIEYIPGEKEFKILKELNEEQKKALEFIKENVLSLDDATGIQKILDFTVFNILEFKAVFPGGVNKLADSEGRILPDCFLMPKNSTVLDFAFKLHTDIGKNFIKAIDVKTKQLKGKDALLQNLDVIEIIFKR
jgi:ribosome-binding ATPase YchF (GTP1/OBG family)